MLGREGYETIYLGNPSEASSEIHLDGAFTSYSQGESGAPERSGAPEPPSPFSLAVH